MRRTVERELRLQADEGFELAQLDGEPLESRVFDSIYFDTSGYRLAHAGLTLRYRVEHGRGLWQLRLPQTTSRVELELAGGPVEPPPEIARLLPGVTRREPVTAVARLRTRRVGLRVRADGDDRSVADVVFDSVEVLDGRRVTKAFEEVEVELLEGDDRMLRRLEKALRGAGAGGAEPRSKLVQALELDLDGRSDHPETTADALALMFRLQLGRIVTHDPGTRLGGDAEDLHQLRVAVRRLRAFLRAARPVVDPSWSQELRGELRWLGGILGPVRDADVLLAYLAQETETLEPAEREALAELDAAVAATRDRARAALLQAMEADRYISLLDVLELAAASPRVVDPDTGVSALWKTEFRRLERSMGKLTDSSPDEALHKARIKAKRARYAAELAAPVIGKRAKRFAEGAKELQDVLGEHQDAVVAEERIRELLAEAGAPQTHFAAGRIVERQRARRAAARAGYERAWKKLEKLGRAVEKG